MISQEKFYKIPRTIVFAVIALFLLSGCSSRIIETGPSEMRTPDNLGQQSPLIIPNASAIAIARDGSHPSVLVSERMPDPLLLAEPPRVRLLVQEETFQAQSVQGMSVSARMAMLRSKASANVSKIPVAPLPEDVGSLPIAPLPSVLVEHATEEPRRLVDQGAPIEIEVRAMMREYLRAFNAHDSQALAASWSEQAENVDLETGTTTTGRAAVEEVFRTLFEQDAAATIDIAIGSVRPIRDDVALVDGVSTIFYARDASSESRFTAVVTRHLGRWFLESVREAPIRSESVPLPLTHHLDELAWLVGQWEDISDNASMVTNCFWSGDRAFLIRNYSLSIENASPRSATQFIGWDPERQEIRSWNFDSDGSFGEGTWSRDIDTWTISVQGVFPDGRRGTATQVIRRVGPDEMTTQMVSHDVEGFVFPNADSIRVVRVKEEPIGEP